MQCRKPKIWIEGHCDTRARPNFKCSEASCYSTGISNGRHHLSESRLYRFHEREDQISCKTRIPAVIIRLFGHTSSALPASSNAFWSTPSCPMTALTRFGLFVRSLSLRHHQPSSDLINTLPPDNTTLLASATTPSVHFCWSVLQSERAKGLDLFVVSVLTIWISWSFSQDTTTLTFDTALGREPSLNPGHFCCCCCAVAGEVGCWTSFLSPRTPPKTSTSPFEDPTKRWTLLDCTFALKLAFTTHDKMPDDFDHDHHAETNKDVFLSPQLQLDFDCVKING